MALLRWSQAPTVLPGLSVAVGIAAVAWFLSRLLVPSLPPVLAAVLLGLAVGNLLPLPAALSPGLSVAARQALRLGVVFLGARLTMAEFADIGGPAIGVIAACMTTAFLAVAIASRVTGIPPRLAALIGVGTAVCGNTAIMPASPIIDAKERETSFAVATITLLGTVALVLFPLAARAFELPDRVFGFWAGLAINDTSQVVAAGAAYSPEALEVATVVKLVRNVFMVPVVLLLAAWEARRHRERREAAGVRRSVLASFPLFLLGFLALALLRSLGVLSDQAADRFGLTATALITVAIAAVGCSTRVDELRRMGPRPLVAGAMAAMTLAIFSLSLAQWLGG